MDYNSFLKNKLVTYRPSGFTVDDSLINQKLFDWQRVLVQWALAKGRSALFEDCGLGKTPQQLEWARQVHLYTNGDIIIFAPLAVSQQTVREGKKFNIKVNRCESQSDVKPGINITNYERLDKFDPNAFVGLVLDESSITEVCGSDKPEYKEDIFLDFADNNIKALITKPKIAMWGLNWQNCNHTVITGLSHSYEQFYQLVRRFYRFGQTKPVHVHIVIGEREGDVLNTIKRKEKAMAEMFASMVKHMNELTKKELKSTSRDTNEYDPQVEMILPKFMEVA